MSWLKVCMHVFVRYVSLLLSVNSQNFSILEMKRFWLNTTSCRRNGAMTINQEWNRQKWPHTSWKPVSAACSQNKSLITLRWTSNGKIKPVIVLVSHLSLLVSCSSLHLLWCRMCLTAFWTGSQTSCHLTRNPSNWHLIVSLHVLTLQRHHMWGRGIH